MAYLATRDGARLYYEVHGEGGPDEERREPLLLLNGIMMSTPSWAAFVPVLARRHRLILLDFRDQGLSSRMDRDYDLEIHVDDVRELLDELGIDRVHLLGLSYGGQVALRFALRNRDRLRTLILSNVTHSVTNHLRAIGKAWETAAELNDGERFFALSIPFIYSASFYQESLDVLERRQQVFKELLTREWFEGLGRLSRSVASYHVAPDELRAVAAPTLLIGADEDLIAPVRNMEVLQEHIAGCEFVVIYRAGHGAFLERMNDFLTIVVGFTTKHAG
jgi:pimeloyl-ACP methyl ester carboxylesterase